MALYANENRWDDIVLQVAATVGDVEPALIKAVIGCESSFAWLGDLVKGSVMDHPSALDRYEAHLNTHSVGPMQVLPPTASWFAGKTITRENLWDPWTNIFYGASYLSAALNGWRPGSGGTRKYGHPKTSDVRQVAAWYNGGFGVATPWPAGVVRYADCVQRNYRYFRDYAVANAAAAPAGTDSILGIPVVSAEEMGQPDVTIQVAGRGAASVFDVLDEAPAGNGAAPPPSAQPRTEPVAEVGTFWWLLALGAGVLLWANRRR